MDAVIDHQRAPALDKHFEMTSTSPSSEPLRNGADHDAAVKRLNALLDAGAGEEGQMLADRAAALGESIAEYDAQHHRLPDPTSAQLLRFLMTQHALHQTDLAAEIGAQGVVSQVLHGKPALNPQQMRAPARRFHIPVAAFIGAQQDAAA